MNELITVCEYIFVEQKEQIVLKAYITELKKLLMFSTYYINNEELEKYEKLLYNIIGNRNDNKKKTIEQRKLLLIWNIDCYIRDIGITND